MALSKKYCDEYNNAVMSPIKYREKDRTTGNKKSDSDDSLDDTN